MSAPPSSRLHSIDALRGLVILFMLLDHVRETFYLHMQVSDPMDVAQTDPALFFSRTLAHLCAPVFILLTGLSAFLYGEKHEGRAAVSSFLFKRGLFLVVLEFTLVNFAWTFQLPPSVIYLQVIWAIGLSMLALAGLIWLPRALLVGLGVVLVAGHNLLDGLHFPLESALHVPWAVLHDRGWIEVSEGLRLRTSYPLLPWIGVIALGYGIGPWFARGSDAGQRRRRLLLTAGSLLGLFFVLRLLNGYGEKPWISGDTALQTLMSFFNITKYPPSLLFLALTLGLGLLLLVRFERGNDGRVVRWLAVFGAAPMFFYLLHLYVLKLLYLLAVALWGANHGQYFGFDSVGAVWLVAVLLALGLYLPVRWFARLKARRRDIVWLKYL
ncbi:heparan-alpha-glucosaminide N-acetyltransferase domain-containing protein [Pseudomonas sp. 148P]|uniref:Heparan-alpha-glucosaminide N-acetyltransferase domain-containing protein n=1 Tax=Pseudomonas ulcerans TaxID=3115852 RepID=A0ABU7HQS5_9PSED|nr:MULTISPECIES: heparan-alpha-glucosaminide N-acetyltransferase domain-containing protein [unclassified Pseudomonas]MEE1923793.1 heparan-alpha-glucosaminide N-acetyltransferase domain-containing protein [Pseudomonas sp. 147P]MEE1933853.1 heparan-alpha-glucosaminide N-acetyltransferase domain-containing protein [Pseudomonas sp. 148P]